MYFNRFTATSPPGTKFLKVFANLLLFFRLIQLAVGLCAVNYGWFAYTANLFRYPNAGNYLTVFIVASVACGATLLTNIHAPINRFRLLKTSAHSKRACCLVFRTAIEIIHAALWTATGILYVVSTNPIFVYNDAHYHVYFPKNTMSGTEVYDYGVAESIVYASWALSLVGICFVALEEIWAGRVRTRIIQAMETATTQERNTSYHDTESVRSESEDLPPYESDLKGFSVDKK